MPGVPRIVNLAKLDRDCRVKPALRRPGLISMLPCIYSKANDGLLAQCLGGLQPVQALDQHEARAVRTHQDGRLLAVREHALRDFLDALWIERGPPLYRHVDGIDREVLALHHNAAKPSML